MDEEFRTRLYAEVSRLVEEVAKKRDVDVPKYVFEFLTALMFESYEFRRDEWRNRLAFDDDDRVFGVASVIAERLLMEAKTYNTPETKKGKSLLLIGLVHQIKKWWCSFPLCD